MNGTSLLDRELFMASKNVNFIAINQEKNPAPQGSLTRTALIPPGRKGQKPSACSGVHAS
jgi:hypothetical protein